MIAKEAPADQAGRSCVLFHVLSAGFGFTSHRKKAGSNSSSKQNISTIDVLIRGRFGMFRSRRKRVEPIMTAYQALLAREAGTLAEIVAANLSIPVIPLTIGQKTVLNAQEIALPSEDLQEVERRFRSIKSELKASGELEEFFARRVATMTVRVERGVRLETVTLADKVRRAVTDFDASRVADAWKLYDWITADPIENCRKLHQTIEGVDRMIRAFQGLKDDLLKAGSVRWDWPHLEKIENLMGRRLGDFPISRAKALSEAIGGDFQYLEPSAGEGLEAVDRQNWARERMAELIDGEVERLEAHLKTFDLDDLARERSESVDRVLFDPSKEATQARKFEAAAERSLYRALGELRKLQARKAKDAIQAEFDDNFEPDSDELGSFLPGDPLKESAYPARPLNPARNRDSRRSGASNGSRKPGRSPST
jgi:hypothetical protein